MKSPDVKIVTASDEAAAVDTIVLAFASDPMARWSWPRSLDYLATMPRLVHAFGGKAFAQGGAWCTEDYAGVALWLPPGVHPDEEALVEITGSTVPASIRDDVFGVFEQMAKYHPSEPHWYLPLIGVDPVCQSKGYGDALMTHALQRCDADRLPAYLESSNPRNISLYRRHGFESLGAIQVGTSPPVVPMLRAPR